MRNLKKISIAILIAIALIIAYLMFSLVDVEDKNYHQEKQEQAEVTQSQ